MLAVVGTAVVCIHGSVRSWVDLLVLLCCCTFLNGDAFLAAAAGAFDDAFAQKQT
jgi:hypothetical protein